MGCNKSKSAGSIADSLAEDSRRRIVANAEKVLREEKAAAKKQKILNAMPSLKVDLRKPGGPQNFEVE